MLKTKSKGKLANVVNQKVESEAEFLKLRKEHTADLKRDTQKNLDAIEGSHILISVTYDKKDPIEPDGHHTSICVSGSGVHDILALVRGLDEAKEDLLEQAIAQLDIKETIHLMAHLAGDEIEEE